MGVIAFILALNLSTMDVFAEKSKYIKKEVSVADLFLKLLNTKGPKRMFA